MIAECYRVAIKPGLLPQVREWAKHLNSESSRVIELLRAEGVQIESVFLEETESGASLIYYLRSVDPVRAREVSRFSTDPIDLYHQKVMKEISAGWTRLECLLDVGTADEPQQQP